MIHLDADIVIAYLNGNRDIARRLRFATPDVAISAIVLAELLYGAGKSSKPAENLTEIQKFLQFIAVAPFDTACAEIFATLKIELHRKGKPTGSEDTLIAATAIAHGADLVTHNTRHFKNISGLKLQDWLS